MGSKKTVKLLLSLMMFVCMAFGFTACDKECAHEWSQATCTTAKTCTICHVTEGEPLGHTWENATCTQAKTCAVCSATEGEALGHTWGEATCTSGKLCTVCQETEGEPLGHNYGSWVITKQPDCTTEGEQQRICSVCDDVDTQTIDKEAHAYAASSVVTNPTCTEQGYTTHTCVCGETKVDTYVNALGHDYEMGTWISTDENQHWKKCSRCDSEDVANKANHVYEYYTSNGNDTHTGTCVCGKTATSACAGGAATCQQKATCEVCNELYGVLSGHDYDLTRWGYQSAAGHAHVCKTTGCEEHDTVVAHTSGGAATEDEPELCVDCQYIIQPATGHIIHTAKAEWSTNATHHWHDCIGCSENPFDMGEHIFDNNCDTTCNTCGYTRTIEHTYAWEHSATEHWQVCACGAEKPNSRENHHGGNKTCTAQAVCTDCQTAYGDKAEHAYAASSVVTAPTCTEQGYTTHTCVCGETKVDTYVNATGHAYGDWAVNNAATCTEKGEKQKVCSACGDIVKEDIPATGHTYTKDVTAPTCTEQGYTTYTCVCGDTKEADFKEALGHDFKDTIVAPTCTQDGYTLHSCQRGGCTYSEKDTIVTTTGHSWVAANCTQAGYCEKCGVAGDGATGHTEGTAATCEALATCSVCGEEYGSYAPHNYLLENAIPTNLCSTATCQAAATYYKTCACGEKGEETFTSGEKLEHAYGKWTAADGVHTRSCGTCGAVDSGNCSGGTASCTNPAICSVCQNAYGLVNGHSYGEWTQSIAPTCTVNGEKTQTCSACGDVAKEIVKATGHTYEDRITTPTCTEQGYITHTCLECGDTQTDSYVDATGHSWDIPAQTCTQGQICDVCGETTKALGHDYQMTDSSPATCTEAATETYACSRCDVSGYTNEVAPALGHNVKDSEVKEEKIEESKRCEYQQYRICETCGEKVYGEVVEHHSYTSKITKAATCEEKGEKSSICSVCEEAQTTEIPVDPDLGHTWKEGSVVDGKRTDTCGCGETRTVAVMSDEGINVKGEKDTAIDLGNANITLGDVADKLGDDKVSISAGTLTEEDKANLKLDSNELAQVGDNPIYNFEMWKIKGETEAENEQVSTFDGYVTITLPYTLGENEDVDSIAVWFINDEGDLESIKATYNNGFITFQTNHFSYYTVTRLTPKQRCDLYGHNFRTTTVAPTCTTDGYTLNFCIRCAHSEKTDVKEANGHDYVVATTAATCTAEGVSVYTCNTCHHAYSVKLPALNHKWEIQEQTVASCTQNGFVKYVCGNENCDEQYVEIEKQLAHEFVDSRQAPTCQEAGYTLHTCVHCGSAYKDTLVESSGHSYAYAFVWSEDYASVSFIVTCARCDYQESIDIVEILVKEIEAGCDYYASSEYTVRYTHNGKVHEDFRHHDHGSEFKHNYDKAWKHDDHKHWHVCAHCGGRDEAHAAEHTFGEWVTTRKPTCSESGEQTRACACGYKEVSEIAPTNEHKYSAKRWTYDERGHWNTCSICGEMVNAAEHAFGEGVIVTQATCNEAGELRYSCPVCRYAYTEVIPATNAHSYENGVCKYCGEEENFCNHENLTMTTVDISSYGACLKEIRLLTCDCGEVKYIASLNEVIDGACDLDEGDMEEGVDEEGNAYMSCDMSCNTCDLVVQIYAVMKREGCLATADYDMTFVIGGAVVLEHAHYLDTWSEHETVEGEVDFAEYTPCGGSMTVRKCSICGEITNLSVGGPNCNMTEESMKTETYVDKMGYTHTLMSLECPDCGLIYAMDSYEVAFTSCMREIHYYTYARYGDTLIFECNEVDWEETHNETRSYTMLGETCEDGYEVTVSCSICGETRTYKDSGHRNEYVQVDLSKHSSCGGMFVGYICQVCGYLDEMGEPTINCDISGMAESTYEDGAGNVHFVQSCDCPKCDLTFIMENWEEVETCVSREYMRIAVLNGEESILDWVAVDVNSQHEYETDVEMFGSTCEEGYKLIQMCTVCGNRTESEYHYHRYEVERYELKTMGMCGGFIEISSCIACGGNAFFNTNYYCNWEYKGVNEEGYSTYYCPSCTTTRLEKSVQSEKDNSCHYTTDMRTILVRGEEILLDVSVQRRDVQHNYTYSFVFNGAEDCEQGVTVIRDCADCGANESSYNNGHNTYPIYTLNAAEYGFCANHYFEVHACPCGEHSDVKAPNGYGMGMRYFCEACGFGYTCDVVTEMEDCLAMEGYFFNVYNGEEIIYTYERIKSYEQHTLTTSVNPLEDGSMALVSTCSVCGYSMTTAVIHYAELAYDESFGGYYYDYPISVESEDSYIFYPITTEDTSITIYDVTDGEEKIVFTYHYSGDMIYELQRHLSKGRNYVYRLRYTDHTKAGTLPFVITKPNNNEGCTNGHSMTEYLLLMKGATSCEDGVIQGYYCQRCGIGDPINAIRFNTEHIESGKHYEMSEYGACDGVINTYQCACGKSAHIDYYIGCWDNENSETYEDNGVRHEKHTYTCSTCQKRFVVDYYDVVDACTTTTYGTFTLFIGEEEQFSLSGAMHRSYHHTYEYTYEFMGEANCEGGVYIHCRCQYCGEGETREYYEHTTFLKQKIDVAEFGACGGEIHIYECACGEKRNLERYNWRCNVLSGSQESYMDDMGYLHTVQYMQCEDCGLSWIEDSYLVQEGCQRIVYTQYTFMKGDTVILENGQSINRSEAHVYEYSYVFDGEENCESGVTVVRKCTVCEESYDEYYTHHFVYGRQYNYADYGECDGYVEIYQCPCEREGWLYYSHNCGWMSENTESFVDEQGIPHRVTTLLCDKGTTYVMDRYQVTEGCYRNTYCSYTITVGGVVLVENFTQLDMQDVFHNYTYNYAFENGVEDCEQGVRVTVCCETCGEQYEEYVAHHRAWVKERYDLATTACGGFIEYAECACGKHKEVTTNFNYNNYNTNEYDDESGRRHFVEVRTCDECGLRYQTNSYTIRNEENCEETVYCTVIVNVNEALVTSFNYEVTSIVHEYVVTSELMEGATSCEQGAILTYTCHCGESYTETVYDHRQYVVMEYDLTLPEYGGATCSGIVVCEGCACGEFGDLYLRALCEFEENDSECWIDGYLRGHILTAEHPYEYYGLNYFDDYTRILTCAVTDPVQCGYRIRFSRYWLPVDGECRAAEYKTWQLGYNDETGECIKEITVKTGNYRTYHYYTATEIHESYESGNIKAWGMENRCSLCDSYYIEKEMYREDGIRESWQRLYVNTLDNGERKLFEEYYEYSTSGSEALRKIRYIYADGREWWEQYEYLDGKEYSTVINGEICNGNEEGYIFTNSDGAYDANRRAYVYYQGYYCEIYHQTNYSADNWYRYDYAYDFSGECQRTMTFTNSDGANEVTTESYHRYGYWNCLKDATCTQEGYQEEHCPLCDKVLGTEILIPDHIWDYQGNGMYKCYRCGLENINGASGMIIMEDLSEAEGNGENYVIGYYNRNSVQFSYYVSLILHTPMEDGNDEVVLDFEEFETRENPRAIAFSKSKILALAEAAGYTEDMYDVRFAFVPDGADGSFDYAITFTDGASSGGSTPDEGGEETPVEGEYIEMPTEGEIYLNAHVQYWLVASESGEYTLSIVSTADGLALDMEAYYSKENYDNWEAPILSTVTGCYQVTMYIEAGCVQPIYVVAEDGMYIFKISKTSTVNPPVEEGGDGEVVNPDEGGDVVNPDEGNGEVTNPEEEVVTPPVVDENGNATIVPEEDETWNAFY